MRSKLKMILEAEYNHREYLNWKRKNVSFRGMGEVGKENGGSAILGAGLYTAALSNKKMAREYGAVYFVVNAVPKKPLVFNNLNEWEIWTWQKLYSVDGKPDKRAFFENNTIEDAIQKMGYDGVIIKGREMVVYNTEGLDIRYYKDEEQVQGYYELYVLGD